MFPSVNCVYSFASCPLNQRIGLTLGQVRLAALRLVVLGVLCIPVPVSVSAPVAVHGLAVPAGQADAVGRAQRLGRALGHHGGAAVGAGTVRQRDGSLGVHRLRQGPDEL